MSMWKDSCFASVKNRKRRCAASNTWTKHARSSVGFRPCECLYTSKSVRDWVPDSTAGNKWTDNMYGCTNTSISMFSRAVRRMSIIILVRNSHCCVRILRTVVRSIRLEVGLARTLYCNLYTTTYAGKFRMFQSTSHVTAASKDSRRTMRETRALGLKLWWMRITKLRGEERRHLYDAKLGCQVRS